MLQDQDGYTLDDFLNKRAEENKPYVRPLTNLRFKGYIFRRIYEDNKDEWNAASYLFILFYLISKLQGLFSPLSRAI